MDLFRRARRQTLPGLRGSLFAVVLVAASVSAVPPASAQSPPKAAAEARVLLAKINALQVQTDAALARYDTALTQVATGVTASVTATTLHRAAEESAAQTQEALDERVRTLYTSGGRAGLYSSLFAVDGIEGFTNRVVVMQRLVLDSTRSATDSATAASRAQSTATAARNQVEGHIRTADEIGGELTRLQGLLDEQRRLLDAANSSVRRLKAVAAATAAMLAAQTSLFGITADALRRVGPMPGSPQYFRLYHAAAPTCPGLSWTVLAAIGQVESGHGRNMGPSSAGALGPMQFMPKTFAAYGVDGDHDGQLNIISPADAIFTAAHYLCANGAGAGPAGLRNAVWHYNNANWYVDMVLALAARYATT